MREQTENVTGDQARQALASWETPITDSRKTPAKYMSCSCVFIQKGRGGGGRVNIFNSGSAMCPELHWILVAIIPLYCFVFVSDMLSQRRKDHVHFTLLRTWGASKSAFK